MTMSCLSVSSCSMTVTSRNRNTCERFFKQLDQLRYLPNVDEFRSASCPCSCSNGRHVACGARPDRDINKLVLGDKASGTHTQEIGETSDSLDLGYWQLFSRN